MKCVCAGLDFLPLLNVLLSSKRIYIDKICWINICWKLQGAFGTFLWSPRVVLFHCLLNMKCKSALMWNEYIETVMWPNLYMNCGGIQGLWEIICLCVDKRDNVGICRECQCFIYRGLHSGFGNICTFLSNYPGEKKIIIWWARASKESFSVCAGEMLLYHWWNTYVLSDWQQFSG